MGTFSLSGQKKTHIHVFIGGKSGVQLRSFMIALSALLGKRPTSSIQVVFMDASEMRAKHLTPATTFFDWLLVAEVYFVLSHPHQSLLDGLLRVDVFNSSNHGLVVNEFWVAGSEFLFETSPEWNDGGNFFGEVLDFATIQIFVVICCLSLLS